MATIKEALPGEQEYLKAIRDEVVKADKDRSEKGRIACASLWGQEAMQNLFVEVGDALQKGAIKIHSRENPVDLSGTYKGQSVDVALTSYMIQNRENTRNASDENELRVRLTDPSTKAVVKDIIITRPRNDRRAELGMPASYSWVGRSVDYPAGWKSGDGGGDMPETILTDVMGDDGLQGFVSRQGMTEDMYQFMETMNQVMEGLTPFKSNSEFPKEQ